MLLLDLISPINKQQPPATTATTATTTTTTSAPTPTTAPIVAATTTTTLTVPEAPARRKLLLVGCSMGAWIALLVALQRPEQVCGVIGVGSAPDFTEDLLWAKLTEAEKATLMSTGSVQVPSRYQEEPYVFTPKLIEDGRRHLLLTSESLPVRCPVRLLHGLEDEDVPWEKSTTLAKIIQGEDVRVILVKAGDHRLSRPADVDLLLQTVAEMLQLTADQQHDGILPSS
ncbi:unnamed protein product [Polarella glacialis]|uniref:Uncharacterized protein n=1 Tax=Polarella glacialis TaxID=89957 RepID=A0A813FV71_POLGL|nr:unnamed protein product [Polarella glacialis]